MNRIGYKLDAVISGFAIGAGFSVVENILYLTIFPDYGAGTWLVRGLGTAVMHGTTLALLAAIAHEFAERETREAAGDFDFNLLWFLPGYLVAVAIHTAFNQFPDRPLLAMMGADPRRADRDDGHLPSSAPPRRSAGSSPNSPSTRRSSMRCAPAAGPTDPPAAGSPRWPARLDAEGAKRVRRYWELQAWLVAEAEETMMEEAAGDATFDKAEVRAAFAELDGLARARAEHLRGAARRCCRSAATIYWEVAELSSASPEISRLGVRRLRRMNDGGEGGIRTHGTVARTPHFECGAFDHSATSPRGCVLAGRTPARSDAAL